MTVYSQYSFENVFLLLQNTKEYYGNIVLLLDNFVLICCELLRSSSALFAV
jgi:hypothetical protein